MSAKEIEGIGRGSVNPTSSRIVGKQHKRSQTILHNNRFKTHINLIDKVS